MRHLFLTARWSNVVFTNYRIPAALLQPHDPPGSELDTPDGAPELHLLSVVALNFDDLRVYRIPIPTAQRFSELNLRFYVRCGPLRAAVFLREFVPARLVVLGARLCYAQPYHRASISHRVQDQGPCIDVRTCFTNCRRQGEIRLRARKQAATPPDTEEHFLKEHYWGFFRYHHRSRGSPWRSVADTRLGRGAAVRAFRRRIDRYRLRSGTTACRVSPGDRRRLAGIVHGPGGAKS